MADAKRLVDRVLDDEGLTDGLGDDEARVLVDWLVLQVEAAAASQSEENASAACDDLRRRARVIRRIALDLCESGDIESAKARKPQWADRVDRLPTSDPVAIIRQLLAWEQENA